MSDEDQAEAPEAADAKKKPKKKGGSKLLKFGLPLVVLIAGGGGGGWWYMQQAAAAATTEAPVEKEPTGMLSFDGFVVNLADPGGRRFLRVSMMLLVPTQKEAKEVSENELKKLKIHSALLELLSTKVASQLWSAEGRAELKKAIAETANHAGQLEVRDVLFKEFVVQ